VRLPFHVTAEAHDIVLINPEDYLAAEENAEVRSEFLNGLVYAMAGTSMGHNAVAGNIFAGLHQRLRSGQCRPFFADIKVRVCAGADERYYYPDVGVTCRKISGTESIEEEPAVIFEVLSDSTRRVDTGEKRDGYLKIPSLHAYVLVEPRRNEITVYRRTDTGWRGEVLDDPAAVLRLPEIGCELPLSEIYAGTAGR
jgi:Uma2 family endonuclease